MLGSCYLRKLKFIILLAGHTNNQYNTCLWQLIKSGKSKEEAQATLRVNLRLFEFLLFFYFVCIVNISVENSTLK